MCRARALAARRRSARAAAGCPPARSPRPPAPAPAPHPRCQKQGDVLVRNPGRRQKGERSTSRSARRRSPRSIPGARHDQLLAALDPARRDLEQVALADGEMRARRNWRIRTTSSRARSTGSRPRPGRRAPRRADSAASSSAGLTRYRSIAVDAAAELLRFRERRRAAARPEIGIVHRPCQRPRRPIARPTPSGAVFKIEGGGEQRAGVVALRRFEQRRRPGPLSTTLPCRITIRRHAIAATTRRSCEMNM